MKQNFPECFRNILCATDLRDSTLSLERFCLRLAESFEAHVGAIHVNPQFENSLLHVFEDTLPRWRIARPMTGSIEDKIHRRISERLKHLNPEIPSMESIVRFGDPASAILQEAQFGVVDWSLLVMGKHSHTLRKTLHLGSIVEKVSHQCHVPVFLIPDCLFKKKSHLKNISVATSLDLGSADAEEQAAGIAQALGTGLTLVHVKSPHIFQNPGLYQGGYASAMATQLYSFEEQESSRELSSKELYEKLDRRCEELTRKYKVSCNGLLLEGDVSTELLRHTQEKDVDLLVVGTHAKAGVQRFFTGGKASRVINHCEVPLLVVRHKDFALGEVKGAA